MFEALIAWLVATFLLGPIQADIAGRMAAARAPASLVQQVGDCATEAAPRLITRTAEDPIWAISQAFAIWAGTARAEAVLGEAAPACGPALAAARPFLQGG
jgi:hypothetical protein